MSSLLFLPFYILFIALANLAVGYFVANLLGWGPKRSDRRAMSGVDLLAQPPAHLLRDDAARPTSFLLEEAATSTSLEGATDLPLLPEPIEAPAPLDEAPLATEEADQWDDAVRALASVELPGESSAPAPAGDEASAEANFLSDLINQSLAQSEETDETCTDVTNSVARTSPAFQTPEGNSPDIDRTSETLDAVASALSSVDAELPDCDLSQLIQDSLAEEDTPTSHDPIDSADGEAEAEAIAAEADEPITTTTVTNNEISIHVDNLESLVLQSLGLDAQELRSTESVISPESPTLETSAPASPASESSVLENRETPTSPQAEPADTTLAQLEELIQQSLAADDDAIPVPEPTAVADEATAEQTEIPAQQPVQQLAAEPAIIAPIEPQASESAEPLAQPEHSPANRLEAKHEQEQVDEPAIDIESLLGTDIETLCAELRRSSCASENDEPFADNITEGCIGKDPTKAPDLPAVAAQKTTETNAEHQIAKPDNGPTSAALASPSATLEGDNTESLAVIPLDEEAADIEAAIMRSLSDDVNEISELVASQTNPPSEPAPTDEDAITQAAVLAALEAEGTAHKKPFNNEPRTGIAPTPRPTKHSSHAPSPHLTLDEEIAEAVRLAISEAR